MGEATEWLVLHEYVYGNILLTEGFFNLVDAMPIAKDIAGKLCDFIQLYERTCSRKLTFSFLEI